MQEILSKEMIGQRLKSLRIKHGHSQEFVSKILKISRSNYSQIEIGNQYPTYDSLSLIASYYSKSYNWLLHGDDPVTDKKTNRKQVKISKELAFATMIAGEKVTHVDEDKKSDYIIHLNSLSYLTSLPTFDLPVSFINSQSNYRAFTIGDNEHLKTIYCGDVLIGKQVTNYSQIVVNETYIIITLSEILFCKIEDIVIEDGLLVCKTDKTGDYEFTVEMNTIQEIWVAVSKISKVIQPIMEDLENTVQSLEKLIGKLEKEVSKINTLSNK